MTYKRMGKHDPSPEDLYFKDFDTLSRSRGTNNKGSTRQTGLFMDERSVELDLCFVEQDAQHCGLGEENDFPWVGSAGWRCPMDC